MEGAKRPGEVGYGVARKRSRGLPEDDKKTVRIRKVKCFDPKSIEVLELVGVGATGLVAKAHVRGLGVVAMKGMPWSCEQDSQGIVTVPFELLVLSVAKHERIPQLRGVCMSSAGASEILILQDYIEGPGGGGRSDLWSFLHGGSKTHRSQAHQERTGRKLSVGNVARIAYQLTDALHFLHSRLKFCHCDVSSRNVLLDKSFGAHLIDFGCARRQEGSASLGKHSDSHEAHASRGSLPWMAPEVVQGARPTEASDLYSLGVVLLELCLETPPWPGYSDSEIECAMCQMETVLGASGQLLLPADLSIGAGERGALAKMLRVAQELLSPQPSARPSSAEVKATMKRISDLLT